MRSFFATLAATITMILSAASYAEVLPVSPPAPAATAAVPAEKSVTTAPSEKRLRIGYADILKIAEQSDAGKVAKTHYEAKADRIKSQIDTKQKLLEKQKSNLEAKLPTYAPEQREKKIKEYEKKVEELRKMLQNADKEMRPMQEELMKEIYGKIETAAKAYGEANGFSAIIEKREILFLGKSVDAEDVTDALVKEVNRK
ncbi:MAG: OmpH family outer membrane protein [Geobacteraceae bacterium]|nr:OmpH family outer membrane protein [Geobacteraceae bacterium]